MDYKFWRNLRKKENKTDEEILLLKLRYTVMIIGEILVDNSKLHCTDEKALKDIRDSIDSVVNEL
ncbi:hypothetical protein [Clostridium sp. C8-1-8]|uniref:hypothetical protein n=1 Tax=Clostridium sp. C8-1-8 TaxID=2698831 RepID=UPI00136A3357|nr:hypothetical protein [Clostridium sp. C8-1-8]